MLWAAIWTAAESRIPPERSPPENWLGSISPGPAVMGASFSQFCHEPKLSGLQGGFHRCRTCRHVATRDRHHAFVNRFILPPKFSPAQAEVDCDRFHSPQGPVRRVRIPQPPSPPGLLKPDPGRSIWSDPEAPSITPR